MIITTTYNIENEKIDNYVGVLYASASKTYDPSISTLASNKKAIKNYEDTIAFLRKEALNRLVKEGEKLNADALIDIRFEYKTMQLYGRTMYGQRSNIVRPHIITLTAIGTGVKFVKIY